MSFRHPLRAARHAALCLIAQLALLAAPHAAYAIGTADGNIPIGTTTIPPSELGVYGGATIGANYINIAAPTNGLLVSGNVGIGTTSPSNKLVVGSDIGATGVPNNSIGVGNASGNSSLTLGQDNANRVRISWIYNATTSSAYTIFGSNATQPLVLQDTGGNVGIGTINPGSPLQIGNDLAFSNNWPTIGFNENPNTTTYLTSNYAALVQVDYSHGGLAFWTAPSGTSGASVTQGERMFISGSGNVGIGTTVMANSMDINGNVSIGYVNKSAPTNGLIVSGNVGIGTTSPVTQLDLGGQGAMQLGGTGAYEGFNLYYNSGWKYRAADYGYIIRHDGGDLGFYTAASGTAGATASLNEPMVILSTGNVGIGTTSPLSKLSVAGNLAIGSYGGGASTTAAPSNGLIVSGSIGIGSSSPVEALDVSGSIYGHSVSVGTSTTVNWGSGNIQYTTASCGAFSFSGMQDGGSYTLMVEGTTVGTCSFSNTDSPTLTFRLPSNFGATTSGYMTLFNFTRGGTYVFVTWMPGY